MYFYCSITLSQRSSPVLLNYYRHQYRRTDSCLYCLATHTADHVKTWLHDQRSQMAKPPSRQKWVFQTPPGSTWPSRTCCTENFLWSSICPTRAEPPATFSPSPPPGWSGGFAPDFRAGCFFGSCGHLSWARPRNLWIKTQWSQALLT